MARFGKPNATGRSSGKRSGRAGKLNRPPEGEPWAWLTAEMLASLAWRSLSANGRRLIDFLLLEHCRHAGQENGHLIATHRQLREYGLTAVCVRSAIEECAALGFVRYERGGRWAGSNKPSVYRLTFYSDYNGNPASNEWKAVSTRMEKAAKAQSCSGNTEHHRPKRRLTKAVTSELGPVNDPDFSALPVSPHTPGIRSPSISRLAVAWGV